MDAVEFLKGKDRMCRSFNDNCKNKDGNNFCCGMRYEADKSGESCEEYINNHPAKAVEIVEQWAKEHPIKTRQSEFLKLFPDARLFDGVLAIDPCKINSSRFDSKECRTYSDEFGVLSCDKCREQFWNEEVDQ